MTGVIRVNYPPWDLVAIAWPRRDRPVREGSMKLIESWSRDGALEIEVVFVDDVRVDRNMAALLPDEIIEIDKPPREWGHLSPQ